MLQVHMGQALGTVMCIYLFISVSELHSLPLHGDVCLCCLASAAQNTDLLPLTGRQNARWMVVVPVFVLCDRYTGTELLHGDEIKLVAVNVVYNLLSVFYIFIRFNSCTCCTLLMFALILMHPLLFYMCNKTINSIPFSSVNSCCSSLFGPNESLDQTYTSPLKKIYKNISQDSL